jgi:hypothetical protein
MRTIALLALAWRAFALDLTNAVVVPPPGATAREKLAAAMLVEEVEKRAGVRWTVAGRATGVPAIRFSRGAMPAEGYALKTDARGATITASSERGMLFGAGRLLRELRWARWKVDLPEGLAITTAPRYALRGHQLGYRPKTNSYDGWNVAQWEQYIRDLAAFGANAVELIPPRSDDAADSPHFPLPPMRMMTEMSRLLDAYGLDVWIWYPALDKDYTTTAAVDKAVAEWAEVFRQLPRVDAVFVPGGDPGHTQPRVLMALLEKQTRSLRRFHPKAGMWVSPQGFSKEWMDEFLGILRGQQPTWLAGVVFGPQIRMSLPELRAAVPARYPIRHYPDITHSIHCQYPVPEWDVAYAATEGRETINPRPTDQAAIFRLLQPHTIGFLTYSEGCNDDVNKTVWSMLGWDPETPVDEILRQYSRFFLGEAYTASFAQGLLALERNWRGPLAANAGVYKTLDAFQSLERAAAPATRANWRFQQALYRAYYDGYTRARLIYESDLEDQAMIRLRRAVPADVLRAFDEAEAILDSSAEHPQPAWRARVFELAEALFQSIRMQLSVPRYQAISVDRGANLDTIDQPLNSRGWLKQRFAELRSIRDENQRLHGLAGIAGWTDPGPGGFYDDLGNPALQPHLVPGLPYDQDPAFLSSPLVSFRYRADWRKSWWDTADALGDAPLRMHYDGLDPAASYRVGVVYAGDNPRVKIGLTAGGIVVHPLMDKPSPVQRVEFDIPREATRSGSLDLEWRREPGLGGNGRGCQVAEIWLLRK